MVSTVPSRRVASSDAAAGAKTMATAVIAVPPVASPGRELVAQRAPPEGVNGRPKAHATLTLPPLKLSERASMQGRPPAAGSPAGTPCSRRTEVDQLSPSTSPEASCTAGVLEPLGTGLLGGSAANTELVGSRQYDHGQRYDRRPPHGPDPMWRRRTGDAASYFRRHIPRAGRSRCATKGWAAGANRVAGLPCPCLRSRSAAQRLPLGPRPTSRLRAICSTDCFVGSSYNCRAPA